MFAVAGQKIPKGSNVFLKGQRLHCFYPSKLFGSARFRRLCNWSMNSPAGVTVFLSDDERTKKLVERFGASLCWCKMNEETIR